MKIEKISNDKLKFIFSMNELEKENIDYQSFMSGSDKCENIINSLLYIAQDELDFNTKDCNIEIETFEVTHGNFVITVTKFNDNPPKLKAKRKTGDFSDCSCVYEFSSFDNYIDFTYFLKTNFNNIFEIFENNKKLYHIFEKCILIIDTSKFSSSQARIFNSCITEFGKFKSNSSILISKIEEAQNN